jgi:hypothetical protein
MKTNALQVLALAGVASVLTPLALRGGLNCIYGWQERLCIAHQGNSSPGSCTTTPPCQGWTTPAGNSYDYPCLGENAVLSYCEEYTYTVTYTHYDYVSDTRDCPRTCGTVYPAYTISVDCTGQYYEYC